MDSNNNEKILIEAGLSGEQASVYQALLEKGPQKASSLSKWTGIERTLIYKVSEQLKNMGLIAEKGTNVVIFSANHPSLLMNSLEQKERALKMTKELLSQNIGQLASQFNLLSDKPNVQFYEGKEGIQKVLDDTLTIPKGSEIYTYTDLESILKYIPDINESYSSKREKLGIKKKGILLDTPKAREAIKNYLTEITETKFIPFGVLEFETVIQIYNNKISYITLKEDSMIGIIIEDPFIYKIQKAIFEHLWKITPALH